MITNSKSNINYFLIFIYIAIAFWFLGFILPLIMKDNNLCGFKQDFNNRCEDLITFEIILKNNLNATFNILIIGIMTFGFYSSIMIFINGLILGIYTDYAINELKIPLKIVLLSICPHFLEYFALWISCSLSFYSIIILSRLVLGNKDILTLKEIYNLIVFLLIIVLFVIIAAYVEANISLPIIMES